MNQHHQPMIRIWTLGLFQVERRIQDGVWEEVPAHEWGRTLFPKKLLQFLLCHNRLAWRKELMEEFWSQSDPLLLEEYLNKAAIRLRQVLGSDTDDSILLNTVANRKAYQLADQSRIWIDADACEHLLAEAKRAGSTTSQGLPFLKQAADLFLRGPFLAETGELWSYGRQGHLQTMRYRCLLDLIDAYHQQQQWHEAETIAEYILQEEPLDEAALSRLLHSLHYQGMTSEAQRRWRQAKQHFKQHHIPLPSALDDLVHTLYASQERQQKPNIPWRSEQEDYSQPTDYRIVGDTIVELQTMPFLQEPSSLEMPQILEKNLFFGQAMAQLIVLIQQWYGMTHFLHDLQFRLDHQIKMLQPSNTMNSLEMQISRRNILMALASLPKATLQSTRQSYKIPIQPEEYLPQCAAGITACWHLSSGNHLHEVVYLLDTYIPVLTSLLRFPTSYQIVAAELAAQCYSLKAILAWHTDGLERAELYSKQALQYSMLAKNKNIHLVTLSQQALIYYYAKQFSMALTKSEEAYSLLQKSTHERIFPIVEGRVCMYLSVFQAQHAYSHAEHTLDLARKAFTSQKTAQEPIPLYADCGETPLSLWDGLLHFYCGHQQSKHLNQAHQALQLYGKTQPDSAIPERFRLECLNNRTLVTIQQNNLDEAILCYQAGKAGALQLSSKQRTNELAWIYQKMLQQWPHEKQIQMLNN